MQDLTLNTLQEKVFRVIAKALLNPNSEQLFMYIGGEGGTGKSRVVEAVTQIFVRLNWKDKLIKMSFTGTAAYNISSAIPARTIHASIGKNKTKRHSHQQKARLHQKWVKVLCQIIDEISYCSKDLFENINEFQKALLNSEELFARIHTLMLGDFLQHLAIGKPVYDSPLWKCLRQTIILLEQVRAAGDPIYLSHLGHVRQRNCTESDMHYFKTKLLDATSDVNFAVEPWSSTTFIIPKKYLGFHINNLRALQHSRCTGNIHYIIGAEDTVKSERISNLDLRNLIIRDHTVPSGDCALYRKIELSKGSRITLIQNIPGLDAYGITNGLTGTVYDIVPMEGTENSIHKVGPKLIVCDKPPVVLFKPDRIDKQLETISYPGVGKAGIIPIFPVTESINIKYFSAGKPLTMSVKRSQLPLTGGYTQTCYKSQGLTYKTAIVDLASVSVPASAYVMLSRLTSLSGLYFLRDFSLSNLNMPLSPKLLKAIRDIELKNIANVEV